MEQILHRAGPGLGAPDDRFVLAECPAMACRLALVRPGLDHDCSLLVASIVVSRNLSRRNDRLFPRRIACEPDRSDLVLSADAHSAGMDFEAARKGLAEPQKGVRTELLATGQEIETI